jgi:DNA-binding LacI/PurR family transcriptional regulator
MGKEKLKSIADIARIAGVSKSTVSRALNDSPLAGTETKDRIRAIARQYGFTPSAVARNLSLRSSKTIAFVNHAYSKHGCAVSDPFCTEIMGAIAVGLHELGYDMLIVHVNPNDRDWVTQFLDSGRVDGFILMTSTRKKNHVDLLIEKGAPFVAWGPGTGGYCTVCGDDFQGGSLAAKRLISIGRSRIAFIGGPNSEGEVQGRYRGYESALNEAGLGVDQKLVYFADYTETSAVRAVEALLDREPHLDAVFVNSDVMAIAAVRTLQSKGLRVPDEVAVIGYDGISMGAYVTPSLTTVSQNSSLIGKLLSKNVVDYIREGTITTTIVPVELIVRDSA